MSDTVAAYIGLALLFLCVLVVYWAKSSRSSQRQRADALARYQRDVESDQ
jgi:hypothetical protein